MFRILFLYMRFNFLSAIVVILIISLFTFFPSFNLALFGDDWLAFFRFREHVDPGFSKSWNYLTYYLTPYGAQDILMGLLHKIFKFQSTGYYFLSYIFRLFAAFSFYPLVFYLTKNKLASFFAILFFSITTTGFDTTNWVFNMPSYITIALFNFSLYLFLQQREKNNLLLLFVSAIFYYLAYITTPIRMHGSLLLIFFLEVFWVLQERKLAVSKKAVIRFVTMLGVFLLIRYTGQSQGPPQEAGERFLLGIKAMLQMISSGNFDFIFNPIIIFGSTLVPDFILPFSIRGTKIFLLFVGGGLSLLAVYLLIKCYKEKEATTGLFLGSSWSILSFFFAWWWQPQLIFPTTYRYLIVSAAGISILLAAMISLVKEKKRQVLLFAILCPIIILHLVSTRTYLNTLVGSHGQDINDKIWNQIPNVPEIGKSREPIIFYFEGDNNDTTRMILHDVITFGFPPHIALLYNLSEKDGGFPVPMSDFNQVISAVTDGQALQAYGYPIKPVPIERIYAFHLQGKDNLINITSLAREKLLQIKSP